MTKLPKQQRDRLIFAVLGTAVVLAALYFGVVSSQLTGLKDLKNQRDNAKADEKSVEESIHNAKKIESELADKQALLKSNEEDMADGDAYAWMLNTIRQFKLGYQVDISQFSSTTTPEVGLYPHFPYKQVAISFSGTGYYHDIGKFVADFENHFQHMRIQDLNLEPPGAPSGNDRDKLSFHLEVVALIKPDHE